MSKSPKEFGIKPKTAVQTDPPSASVTHAESQAHPPEIGSLMWMRQTCLKKLETDPTNPTTLNNLGFTYAEEENWDEAIAYYYRALECDAKHSMTWMNLGCALAVAGDPNDALSALIKAVKFEPRNAKAWDNLGRLFLLGGEARQAEIAFRRVQSLDVCYMPPAIPLSNALAAQGRYEEAITIIKDALRWDESDGELWKQLGVLCVLSGDMNFGAIVLVAAIATLPGDTEARHHLATTQFALGHKQRGILELECILTLDPNHLLARTDLAVLALSEGDLTTAQFHLDLAAKAHPNEPRIRYYQAMVLAQQGDTEQANEIYRELTQSEGKYAELALKQLLSPLSENETAEHPS